MLDTAPLSLTSPIDEVDALLELHLQALWSAPDHAADIPPLMLWGPPGVGKSTVVRALCRRHGIGFLDVRLSQREPVDLRGLPVPRGDRVEWLLPSEWPRDPASRGIILFDEITAADRSLQVAAYELILDRRLGDLYAIPPGWYVVAAGNRLADRAAALTMSSALANRFCHVEVAPALEGWLAWAVEHDLHPEVIAFLRHRPTALFSMDGVLERGWPSPRSWERVSTELTLLDRGLLPSSAKDRLTRVLVAGLVGEGTAIEFLAFRRTASALPDVLAMLEGRAPLRVPERADQRYALCAAASHFLRRRTDWLALAGNFLRLGLLLPSDFAALAMVDVLRGRPTDDVVALMADPLFAAWSERHGTAVASGVLGTSSDIAAAALRDAAE